MITKNNNGTWSTYKPHKLFDHLREMYGLKTDSQLAYLLSTRPPIISRIRNGVLRITPALIIGIGAWLIYKGIKKRRNNVH